MQYRRLLIYGRQLAYDIMSKEHGILYTCMCILVQMPSIGFLVVHDVFQPDPSGLITFIDKKLMSMPDQ